MNIHTKLQLTVALLIMTGASANVSADEVITGQEKTVIIKEAPAPVPTPVTTSVPDQQAAAPVKAVAAPAAGRWFVGAGIGGSTVQGYDCAGCSPITSTDDHDTGFSVFGGYQFNDYLGIQAEYVDLGDRNYTGPGISDRHETTGFGLVGVATWPVMSSLDLFAKAGVFRWEQDIAYADPAPAITGNFSGTDATFGAGADLLYQ